MKSILYIEHPKGYITIEFIVVSLYIHWMTFYFSLTPLHFVHLPFSVLLSNACMHVANCSPLKFTIQRTWSMGQEDTVCREGRPSNCCHFDMCLTWKCHNITIIAQIIVMIIAHSRSHCICCIVLVFVWQLFDNF